MNATNDTATRNEFLADVLIGAVEGGTSYWAAISGYRHDEPSSTQAFFHVLDEPEEAPKLVGLEAISLGIERIVGDEGFSIRKGLRQEIRTADVLSDAGLLDAEASDVIVQAALFGEIVYG